MEILAFPRSRRRLPDGVHSYRGGGRWVRAAFACAVFLSVTVHVAAAEPRRVLLLHAFGHAHSPWSDIAGSFHAELIKKSSEPVDVYEVSLDTARTQDPQDERPFVEYIRAILAGRKLDLIVPVGAPSAFFVQRHRTALFPETPMLILGADARRVPSSTLTKNDTAVLFDIDLPAYVANILRLRPETTEIEAVVGNSPVERFWGAEFLRHSQPYADRVKITLLNDLTLGQMLERAATMNQQSAILWYLLSEDAAGVPYSQDRALDAMRAAAIVPIFGVGDYQLGRGIVGGPLLQTQALGQQAADVAVRILKGETAGDIDPPNVLFGAAMYDWRELQRWGIDEARLPPGSIVRYREPGVWEQYRWYIIAVAVTLLAQSLLIAYGLIQNRRRRAAEDEAALQRQEVAHLMRVSVLGQLSGAIAHEINQPLTAILSNAQAALHLLAEESPDLVEIRGALQDIVEEDNRAGEVVHRLRSLLKKSETKSEPVDVNDLVRSTVALLHSELIARGIDVEIDLASTLPATVGDPIQLQQVLLNLLMNAMDAMATTPAAQRRVALSTRPARAMSVEVLVRDHGPGIRPAEQGRLFEPFYTTKTHGLGLGLTICSTIVEAHGGTLTLANDKTGGALAALSLPAQDMLVAAQ
jgi:signal transduction histidine kinase